MGKMIHTAFNKERAQAKREGSSFTSQEVRQARQDNLQKRGASFDHPTVEPPGQPPIRIFVADRHEVVRAGVRALLEGERDLEVVGEVDNAEDMLFELRRTKPDVVLLEPRLSGGSEFDICKSLFDVLPSVRIISLMRGGDTEAFRHVVGTGAQGYLRKTAGRIELIQAIRTVAKGNSYLSSEDTEQTFRFLRQQQDPIRVRSSLDTLSPQERRIIALIAEGNTNKEIAAKLALSDKTVKNYIANLFTKLEIERRTQAVALYMRAQQHQNSVRDEVFA